MNFNFRSIKCKNSLIRLIKELKPLCIQKCIVARNGQELSNNGIVEIQATCFCHFWRNPQRKGLRNRQRSEPDCYTGQYKRVQR